MKTIHLFKKAGYLFLSVIVFASVSYGQTGNHSERYNRGWEKIKEVDPKVGEILTTALADVSPDLGQYIIEYAFGDVYSQITLDPKSREIAVVAAFTAMGTVQPQLGVHIGAALNAGCSVYEIQEVIMQMAVFSGFPSCINAMSTLKEVVKDRQSKGIKVVMGNAPTNIQTPNRMARGEKELSKLDDAQVERLKNTFKDISPDLSKYVLEFAFSDIFSRNNLSIQHRQIATIAGLTALGNAPSQLKFHINGGLNVGLTTENIKDIMLVMTICSGFPSAINGTFTLKEVVAERSKK